MLGQNRAAWLVHPHVNQASPFLLPAGALSQKRQSGSLSFKCPFSQPLDLNPPLPNCLNLSLANRNPNSPPPTQHPGRSAASQRSIRRQTLHRALPLKKRARITEFMDRRGGEKKNIDPLKNRLSLPPAPTPKYIKSIYSPIDFCEISLVISTLLLKQWSGLTGSTPNRPRGRESGGNEEIQVCSPQPSLWVGVMKSLIDLA